MVATQVELTAAIEDFLKRLQQNIRIEALVLYGSYINGRPNDWSDIDIAVISPDFEDVSLPKRQEIIATTTLHRDARLSPIGYPSSEYHNPRPQSFLREIIRTGKVVYHAE